MSTTYLLQRLFRLNRESALSFLRNFIRPVHNVKCLRMPNIVMSLMNGPKGVHGKKTVVVFERKEEFCKIDLGRNLYKEGPWQTTTPTN